MFMYIVCLGTFLTHICTYTYNTRAVMNPKIKKGLITHGKENYIYYILLRIRIDLTMGIKILTSVKMENIGGCWYCSTIENLEAVGLAFKY